MYDNNIINVLILQVLPNVDIDTPELSSISWVSPNTSNTDTAEFTQESKQVKVITRRNELWSTLVSTVFLSSGDRWKV